MQIDSIQNYPGTELGDADFGHFINELREGANPEDPEFRYQVACSINQDRASTAFDWADWENFTTITDDEIDEVIAELVQVFNKHHKA